MPRCCVSVSWTRTPPGPRVALEAADLTPSAMDRIWQDVRHAAHTLARAPGLSIVAILTLALGIGANSAVFSLVNTVLIRPLPFANADRLATIFEVRAGAPHNNVSAHEYIAWRDRTRSFDGLAMYNITGMTLTGRGDPVTLATQTVTANYFDVLGTKPILGRTFLRGEDEADAARVVVLGRSVWSSRFGGDSTVIGKRVVLDDTPYEIIGVMSDRGDMSFDLWRPMNLRAEAIKVGGHSNFVIGRLKRGVTLAAANKDLQAVANELATEMPTANRGHGVGAVSLFEEMVGDVRRPIAIALGAAAFVLLIACLNVGNLLLTRAASREKELAIRTALGAGRSRLVRQLLTEALLLSIIGGTLGLLVAAWTSDLLPAMSGVHVPRLAELSVDWRVVGATVVLCVTATLLYSSMTGSIRTRRPEAPHVEGSGHVAPTP